jgi:DNA end-binding protein Ku
MAPRAYWNGLLKLSLVTCPIALYPASTQAEKPIFIKSIPKPAAG